MPTLHETLAKSHPKLQRGRVWCRTCGRTQRLDSANALRTGWPKCCGYTMTIDAPDERTPAPSNVERNRDARHHRAAPVDGPVGPLAEEV